MGWTSLAKATLGSAGLGLAGGLIQNQASAKAAKKQMEFQERMSNTAYQRAADDLESAGLNRILALGSPASTPGGAMPNIANLGTAMAEGANTGMSYGTSAQQISTQKASADKMLAETKTIDERMKREIMKTKAWQALEPMIGAIGKSVEGWQMILGEMDAEGLQNFWYFLNSPSEAIRRELGKFFKEQYKGFEESDAGQWILDALGQSIEVTKETYQDVKGLFK